MLRRGHARQKAPDPVTVSALPGMAEGEGAFTVSRRDGLPGRPRVRYGSTADRMMVAASDRRLIEDYLPVDWLSAEASGEPRTRECQKFRQVVGQFDGGLHRGHFPSSWDMGNHIFRRHNVKQMSGTVPSCPRPLSARPVMLYIKSGDHLVSESRIGNAGIRRLPDALLVRRSEAGGGAPWTWPPAPATPRRDGSKRRSRRIRLTVVGRIAGLPRPATGGSRTSPVPIPDQGAWVPVLSGRDASTERWPSE